MTLVRADDLIPAIQAVLTLAGPRKTAEVHLDCQVTAVTVSAASAGMGGVCVIAAQHVAETDGEVHDCVLQPDQVILLAKAFAPKDLPENALLRITCNDDRHLSVELRDAEVGDRVELYLHDQRRSPGDRAPVVLGDWRDQAAARDGRDRPEVLELDAERARAMLSGARHLGTDIDMQQAGDGLPIIVTVGHRMAAFMMAAGWMPDSPDPDPQAAGPVGAGLKAITLGQLTIEDQLGEGA